MGSVEAHVDTLTLATVAGYGKYCARLIPQFLKAPSDDNDTHTGGDTGDTGGTEGGRGEGKGDQGGGGEGGGGGGGDGHYSSSSSRDRSRGSHEKGFEKGETCVYVEKIIAK